MTPDDHPDFLFDVFVSYSHRDAAWVWGWLVRRLKEAGLRVCTDREFFDIGVPAVQNMENAVAASAHVLLVMTKSWVTSEWTLFESLLAQTTDPAGLRQRTIPVLREPCELPPGLAMRTYADMREGADLEFEFEKVLRALRGERIPPAPRVAMGQDPPWVAPAMASTGGRRVGLPAPPENFTGRSNEIGRLRERLTAGDSVAISAALQGMGGVGKTALALVLAWQLKDRFPGGAEG